MYSGNIEINYTLIVAIGGSGKRMGLGYPKQLLEYKGKPLFVNILEVAEKSPIVKNIVLVTKKELIKEVKEICDKFQIKKVSHIIEGGAERQDSIYNALKCCEPNSIIAVQDGVRPFFREDYITKTYDALINDKNLNGVVIGMPVKDTIKVVDENGIIQKTPKRATLFMAQTPQVFRGEILINAYEKAKNEKFLGTDDSSLVERYFGNVKLLEGDYENIKITTIDDIKFLKEER